MADTPKVTLTNQNLVGTRWRERQSGWVGTIVEVDGMASLVGDEDRTYVKARIWPEYLEQQYERAARESDDLVILLCDLRYDGTRQVREEAAREIVRLRSKLEVREMMFRGTEAKLNEYIDKTVEAERRARTAELWLAEQKDLVDHLARGGKVRFNVAKNKYEK